MVEKITFPFMNILKGIRVIYVILTHPNSIIVTTVCEAQKQQLKQPQTPILFWPSNILAMAVIS